MAKAATKTKAKKAPAKKAKPIKGKKAAATKPVVQKPAKKGKLSTKEVKKAVKEVTKKRKGKILSKKTKPTTGKVTVDKLLKASADYNPRIITERELKGLTTSYETYGDLSGVVLNVATNTLVSGHQRLKTIGDRKTNVVKVKHKDKVGTVALGHIEVTTDSGVIKIPYREVNWTDRKAEAAANIAANAGGGQFDNDKLGALLEELDTTDEFLVESIGLDPLTIRQLTSPKAEAAAGSSKSKSGKSDAAFDEYGAEDMEGHLEHTCPRCKFKF